MMKKLENAPVADRVGLVAITTTAELVEWYNAHVEPQNQIKKFADRKTAERRVLALLAEGVKKTAAKPEKIAVKHSSSEVADRSAAVAETWMNPAVAAARAIRDHVLVNGVWYVSVRQAFIELDLPLNEHIKFRKELKRSRKAEAYGCKWSITNERG